MFKRLSKSSYFVCYLTVQNASGNKDLIADFYFQLRTLFIKTFYRRKNITSL